MQISIVIPLLNEEESLAELYQWLTKVLTLNRFSYEIIFVDDGSTDGSWRVIMQLAEKDAQVHTHIIFVQRHKDLFFSC